MGCDIKEVGQEEEENGESGKSKGSDVSIAAAVLAKSELEFAIDEGGDVQRGNCRGG
jgi:hypothetical protein